VLKVKEYGSALRDEDKFQEDSSIGYSPMHPLSHGENNTTPAKPTSSITCNGSIAWLAECIAMNQREKDLQVYQYLLES